MSKASHLLVFLACCGLAAAAAPPRTITFDGIAPVKVGMSMNQAEIALGTKLLRATPGDPDYDHCDYVNPADGRDAAITYMMIDGRIARIEVNSYTAPAKPAVHTANGITIGSSEKSVLKAYGAQAKITTRPYNGEPDHEILVYSPNRKTALLFETAHGKVEQIRVGVFPAVQYWEGCE